MFDVQEFTDAHGRSPFDRWYKDLDETASLKIRTVLARLGQGNTSNVRPVGQGVSECRLDFGPGYRVYFGMDGPTLIILLGGGTKQRQQRDIQVAPQRWQDYRRRKQSERVR